VSRYVVAPRAQQDIDEIYERIHNEDPAVADRFEAKIYETFDLIADFPGMGHPRRDLVGDRPVLFHTIMRKAFAIVYQKTAPVRFLRVVRWKHFSLLRLDED
jgi:plasmid stabilization system protein ParE